MNILEARNKIWRSMCSSGRHWRETTDYRTLEEMCILRERDEDVSMIEDEKVQSEPYWESRAFKTRIGKRKKYELKAKLQNKFL
jgi:hypothetical protein